MPELRAIRDASTEETVEEADLPAAGRSHSVPVESAVCEQQDKLELSGTQQQHQLDGLQSLHCNLAQVEDFSPDIPLTESHMHKISGHLATSWKELSSTELGLDEAAVKRIDSDYSEVQEKAYQALLCWRRTETSNATVGSMMTALQNINRCDVKQMLKDAIKSDVTLPLTPSAAAAAVPPDSRPYAAPIEEPEQNREQRGEPKTVRPSNAFDAEQVQKLDGILDQLHGAVQKLTQSDVRGRIVNEIQSLLKVQEFYEDQMRSTIVNNMFLRIEDDEIAADLSKRQEIRMTQREQTRKLFEGIHTDEVCRKCKPCKDCKEGRRNTFTTGPRPKIKVEPRQAWSLYHNRDGATD